MAKYYPDQKPKFLFDEVERNTHASYNAATFAALQAERDAARAELEKARSWATETVAKLSALQGERDSLAAMMDRHTEQQKTLTTTERNTLLTIIAVLCKEAKLDYNTASKTAEFVQSTAAAMGVSIGETAIRDHLKKIPDALGTRTR